MVGRRLSNERSRRAAVSRTSRRLRGVGRPATAGRQGERRQAERREHGARPGRAERADRPTDGRAPRGAAGEPGRFAGRGIPRPQARRAERPNRAHYRPGERRPLGGDRFATTDRVSTAIATHVATGGALTLGGSDRGGPPGITGRICDALFPGPVTRSGNPFRFHPGIPGGGRAAKRTGPTGRGEDPRGGRAAKRTGPRARRLSRRAEGAHQRVTRGRPVPV